MIKRYNPYSYDGVPTMHPRDNGDYVLYDDHLSVLESIGAGGVSGRVTQKPLDQHRQEFETWAKPIGINTKHKDHPNYLTQGFYRYDVSGTERMWESCLASKGINT